MKIGIIGTGNIGASLVRKLSAAGHDVKVANSRGPQAIPGELLTDGARAVTAQEAVQDVEAVILSVPLGAMLSLAPLFSDMPEDVTFVDTSNYYPQPRVKASCPTARWRACGSPSSSAAR